MKQQKQDKWDGYGTEIRPVAVSTYHVVDHAGAHRFVTINEYALERLGGASEFEKTLAGQFKSFELLGTVETIRKSNSTFEIREAVPGQVRSKIHGICAQFPGTSASVQPWLPADEADDRNRAADTLYVRRDVFSDIARKMIGHLRPHSSARQ